MKGTCIYRSALWLRGSCKALALGQVEELIWSQKASLLGFLRPGLGRAALALCPEVHRGGSPDGDHLPINALTAD